MRLLIFASIFAFMAVVIPASCSPQVIPLGSHNISLDFGGANITVMPMTTAYECCLGVDTNYTKMVDKNTNSSSFAYLFSYDSPRPNRNSEKELKSIMDDMCDKMTIQPYENGYISTGSDRLGGFREKAHPFTISNYKMNIQQKRRIKFKSVHIAILDHNDPNTN